MRERSKDSSVCSSVRTRSFTCWHWLFPLWFRNVMLNSTKCVNERLNMAHPIHCPKKQVKGFNNWSVRSTRSLLRLPTIPFVCSDQVTMENIQLIELAYKSISFDDLQHIFGLNRHTAEKIVAERQWKVNEDPNFLHPRSNGSFVRSFVHVHRSDCSLFCPA